MKITSTGSTTQFLFYVSIGSLFFSVSSTCIPSASYSTVRATFVVKAQKHAALKEESPTFEDFSSVSFSGSGLRR